MAEGALRDEVAALYRTAGYDVAHVDDDASGGLDLLVTASNAGLGTVRYGIVCLSGPVELRRVATLHEALVAAAGRRDFDHAVIIHDGVLSDEARARFGRAGFATRSIVDTRSELLGLDRYLRQTGAGTIRPHHLQVDAFTADSPAHRVPAIEVLERWLDSHREPLVIVGELGSGKSSLCRELVGRVAEATRARGAGPMAIPVVLAAADLASRQIVEVVAATMGLSASAVSHIARLCTEGLLVLVVDGLDEIDEAAARHLLAEVRALVPSGGYVVTTRPGTRLPLPEGEHYVLAPLTAGQRKAMLRELMSTRPGLSMSARLLDDPRLLGGASRPVHVTALAAVLRQLDASFQGGVAGVLVRWMQVLHGSTWERTRRGLVTLAHQRTIGRSSRFSPSTLRMFAASPLLELAADGYRFASPLISDLVMATSVGAGVMGGDPGPLEDLFIPDDAIAFAAELLEDEDRSEVLATLRVWSSPPSTSVLAENATRLARILRSSSALAIPGIVVTHVHLEQIKCFASASFAFGSPEAEEPTGGSVTMFLGDNGTGKSTILQAIALCALGPELAARLVTRTENLLRAGASRGYMSATFEITGVEELPVEVVISLAIERGTRGFHLHIEGPHASRHEQFLLSRRNQTDFQGLFVAGYGATRNFDVSEEAGSNDDQDPLLERTSSLFKPAKALIDPGHLSRLIVGDGSRFTALGGGPLRPATRRKVIAVLRSLLPDDEVTFDDEGNLTAGDGGIPLHELSDGYRSTLAWIGHLVVHLLATAGWSQDLDQVRGIVLIDELDLHLHPRWQRIVVDRIMATFPALQIIATTHSPLVAAGASGRGGAIARLVESGGAATIDAELPSIRGWRADQILASEHFGYLIDRDPATEALVAEATELLGRRDDDPVARRRFDELMGELEGVLPSSGTTEIERDAQDRRRRQVLSETAHLERELFGEGP